MLALRGSVNANKDSGKHFGSIVGMVFWLKEGSPFAAGGRKRRFGYRK
jgi:hypothetical protein